MCHSEHVIFALLRSAYTSGPFWRRCHPFLASLSNRIPLQTCRAHSSHSSPSRSHLSASSRLALTTHAKRLAEAALPARSSSAHPRQDCLMARLVLPRLCAPLSTRLDARSSGSVLESTTLAPSLWRSPSRWYCSAARTEEFTAREPSRPPEADSTDTLQSYASSLETLEPTTSNTIDDNKPRGEYKWPNV